MDLREALNDLAQMIKIEIIERLHSNLGVNQRAKGNTLIGSNLETSIDVRVTGENALVFQIADYYRYIVTGWKRTHSHPGTLDLFLDHINKWVSRKNIRLGNMTQAQIVWYLYKRMIVEGMEIAPRPFINYDENGDVSKILPFLDEFFENWSKKIFEGIIEDLNKVFK